MTGLESEKFVYDWEKRDGFPKEMIDSDLSPKAKEDIAHYLSCLKSEKFFTRVEEEWHVDSNNASMVIFDVVDLLERGHLDADAAHDYFLDSLGYLGEVQIGFGLSPYKQEHALGYRQWLNCDEYDKGTIERHCGLNETEAIIHKAIRRLYLGIDVDSVSIWYNEEIDRITPSK